MSGCANPAEVVVLESALIVLKEHLDKILDPENPKTWEMRGTRTHKRGWVGLIESGSGCVVGATQIVDSLDRQSQFKLYETHHLHQVKNIGDLGYWRFPWVLKGSTRFEKPVPYVHKKGCVIWHNIADLNIRIGGPKVPVSEPRKTRNTQNRNRLAQRQLQAEGSR